MSDFSNVKIEGNRYQKKKIKQTLANVQKYCKPEAADQIPNTVFNVGNNGSRFADEGKLIGNKGIVTLPKNFLKEPQENLVDRVCHDLSHIAWDKKHKDNPYVFGSRNDEFKASLNGEKAKQKFLHDKGVPYMVSEEKIKKEVDENPVYRCLPEDEPTTEYDRQIAIRKNNACENLRTIKDLVISVFKPNN